MSDQDQILVRVTTNRTSVQGINSLTMRTLIELLRRRKFRCNVAARFMNIFNFADRSAVKDS